MAARLGRAPALEKRDGRDPALYTGITGSIPAEGSSSLAVGCPTRNERIRVRIPLGPPFWAYSRMVRRSSVRRSMASALERTNFSRFRSRNRRDHTRKQLVRIQQRPHLWTLMPDGTGARLRNES